MRHQAVGVAAMSGACIMVKPAESEELRVSKKSKPVARKGRSGPRAPAGKAPLQIIIKEQTKEDAKISAIRKKTNVSVVVEELLDGWLDGTYKLKEKPSPSK